MRNHYLLLAFISLVILFSSCLFTKGHFTQSGSMWVWNKDPGGRYNSHNPLQVEAASKWVDTILTIPLLTSLKADVNSKKMDRYEVNDSIMFFKPGTQELANYHSYYTFANRLNTEPELLKRIVLQFDKLGLNRLYKEESFLAFQTVTYLNYSSGYLYFTDSTWGKYIKTGDTLDFRTGNCFKYFKPATSSRFVVLKKYTDRWIAWKETL